MTLNRDENSSTLKGVLLSHDDAMMILARPPSPPPPTPPPPPLGRLAYERDRNARCPPYYMQNLISLLFPIKVLLSVIRKML